MICAHFLIELCSVYNERSSTDCRFGYNWTCSG